MALKLTGAVDTASLKRDSSLLRVCNQKTMRGNKLESVSQLHGGTVVSCSDEGGVVRMKIVVKKNELKQMLANMESCRTNTYQETSSSALEQRIRAMRKKHLGRRWLDHLKGSGSPWSPALQCIPE